MPTAKIIRNFGRADRVDREALARLVASISRFLEPEQAGAAAAGAEVKEITFTRHETLGHVDISFTAATRRCRRG
jgi:hypothetical protein